MNKAQKALTGLVALVAVELLPVSIVATQVLADGIELTYEVDDEQLSELEEQMGEAREQAEKDMSEEDE